MIEQIPYKDYLPYIPTHNEVLWSEYRAVEWLYDKIEAFQEILDFMTTKEAIDIFTILNIMYENVRKAAPTYKEYLDDINWFIKDTPLMLELYNFTTHELWMEFSTALKDLKVILEYIENDIESEKNYYA